MTDKLKTAIIERLERKIKAFDWAQENLSPTKKQFKENTINEDMLEAALKEMRKQ